MPSSLALTAPAPTVRALPEQTVRARLVVYGAPGRPPAVSEIEARDAAALVDSLCDAVADRSRVPGPAVREVVENLVHAGFADALVSVLDDGAVVRGSDHGPGIGDPARAMTPGFTAAGPAERALVRGVGCGLPLARDLLRAEGGGLEIADNIGGGVVVTLSAAPAPSAPAPALDAATSDAGREALALLLEVGAGTPEALAAELGRSHGECGSEIPLL
jgi:hypothetical protein